MEAVEKIIRKRESQTVDQLPRYTCIKVQVDNHEDLIIEKLDDTRVSVGHYYTQMGDLMADPEIVFKITDGEWIPIRHTQHPHLHQYNEDGLADLSSFIERWNKNLERQGFVEAATQQGIEQ